MSTFTQLSFDDRPATGAKEKSYSSARGDHRREQSGPAILLGIALGFGADDRQHDVGRDRLAGLDVGMKCFRARR